MKKKIFKSLEVEVNSFSEINENADYEGVGRIEREKGVFRFTQKLPRPQYVPNPVLAAEGENKIWFVRNRGLFRIQMMVTEEQLTNPRKMHAILRNLINSIGKK